MIVYAREITRKKYVVKMEVDGNFSIFNERELMSLIAVEKNGEYFVELCGNEEDELSFDISKHDMYSVLKRVCDDVTFQTEDQILHIKLNPPKCLYSVVDKFSNHGDKMENPFYGSSEAEKRKYTNLAGAFAVRPYSLSNHDIMITNHQTENSGNTTLSVEKYDSVYAKIRAEDGVDKPLSGIIFTINGRVVDPDSLDYASLIQLIEVSGHNALMSFVSWMMSGDQSGNFRPSAEQLRGDCGKITQGLSLFCNVSSVNYCLKESVDHFDLIFNIICAEGNEIQNVEVVCDEMNAIKKEQISRWALQLSESVNEMIRLNKFIGGVNLINEFRNRIIDHGFEDCRVEKLNNTLYIHPIGTKSLVNYKIIADVSAKIKSRLMSMLNSPFITVDHAVSYIQTVFKDSFNINIQQHASQEGFNKIVELRGNSEPCGWFVSNITQKSQSMIGMDSPGVMKCNLFVFFVRDPLGKILPIDWVISAFNGVWLGFKLDITAIAKEYDNIIRTIHEAKVSFVFQDTSIVLSVGSEIKPLKLLDSRIDPLMLYSLYGEAAVNFISGFSLKCKYDSFIKDFSPVSSIKMDKKIPRLAFSLGWKKSASLGSLNLCAETSVKSEYHWMQNLLDDVISLQNHISYYTQLSAVLKRATNHILTCRIEKDDEEISIPFLFQKDTLGITSTYMNIWECWNSKEVIGDASMFKLMIGYGGSLASLLNKFGQVVFGGGVCLVLVMKETLTLVLYVAYDIIEKEFNYSFTSMNVSLQQQPQYQQLMYLR
jgi:hypothetical protein